MGNLYDELEELCHVVKRKISEANEKMRMSNGDLSGGDVEYIDKLTHTLKSIKTTMAMIDAEENGYSHDGYYNGSANMNRSGRYFPGHGYSYARGRGSNARRDSMGRYSRNGYSMDSGNVEIVEQLREIMQDAPDDRTRQEFQKFISKMESM